MTLILDLVFNYLTFSAGIVQESYNVQDRQIVNLNDMLCLECISLKLFLLSHWYCY